MRKGERSTSIYIWKVNQVQLSQELLAEEEKIKSKQVHLGNSYGHDDLHVNNQHKEYNIFSTLLPNLP